MAEIKTGTDVLRATVRAWNRSQNIAMMARASIHH